MEAGKGARTEQTEDVGPLSRGGEREEPGLTGFCSTLFLWPLSVLGHL